MKSRTKKLIMLGGVAAGVAYLARKMPTWTWLVGAAAAAVMFVPALRRKLLPSK